MNRELSELVSLSLFQRLALSSPFSPLLLVLGRCQKLPAESYKPNFLCHEL